MSILSTLGETFSEMDKQNRELEAELASVREDLTLRLENALAFGDTAIKERFEVEAQLAEMTKDRDELDSAIASERFEIIELTREHQGELAAVRYELAKAEARADAAEKIAEGVPQAIAEKDALIARMTEALRAAHTAYTYKCEGCLDNAEWGDLRNRANSLRRAILAELEGP